jgi:hypothetical protein
MISIRKGGLLRAVFIPNERERFHIDFAPDALTDNLCVCCQARPKRYVSSACLSRRSSCVVGSAGALERCRRHRRLARTIRRIRDVLLLTVYSA